MMFVSYLLHLDCKGLWGFLMLYNEESLSQPQSIYYLS